MQYYDVIYDLTDAVKAAMAGELGPLIVETVVGRAEVREVFSAGKHGKAAGLLVTEGYHPQGAEGAHHPRGRHRLQRLDRLAAPLQGRRRRGPRRPRMRRHLRRTHRHQGRRLSRDLRGRGARADALSQEEREDWKEGAAVEAGFCGLEAGGCCLFSLLTAIALLFVPVSALLMLYR